MHIFTRIKRQLRRLKTLLYWCEGPEFTAGDIEALELQEKQISDLIKETSRKLDELSYKEDNKETIAQETKDDISEPILMKQFTIEQTKEYLVKKLGFWFYKEKNRCFPEDKISSKCLLFYHPEQRIFLTVLYEKNKPTLTCIRYSKHILQNEEEMDVLIEETFKVKEEKKMRVLDWIRKRSKKC